MNRLHVVLLSGILFIGGCGPTAATSTRPRTPDDDLAAMEGKWWYVSRVFDDEVVPVEVDDHLVVTGNSLTKVRGGRPINSTLVLEADNRFYETVREPNGSTTIGRGVYRLDENLAVFVFAIDGLGTSPEDLRLSPERMHSMTVLRR